MFLSKRSNGIYYLWYECGGERKKVSTKATHKSQAIAFLKSFSIEQTKQRQLVKEIPLSEFMAQYLEHSKTVHRPNTTLTARSTLNEFVRIIGNPFVNSISTKEIEKFLAVKSRECNPFTLRKHFITLKSILSTAQRWRYLTGNPFKQLTKPKVPERVPVYFSKENFLKLLSMIDDSEFKELVLFAVLSGTRQAEIAQLKWQDVDLLKKIICVRNSDTFTTKSGKNRNVPMNDELFRMLSIPTGKPYWDYQHGFKQSP